MVFTERPESSAVIMIYSATAAVHLRFTFPRGKVARVEERLSKDGNVPASTHTNAKLNNAPYLTPTSLSPAV